MRRIRADRRTMAAAVVYGILLCAAMLTGGQMEREGYLHPPTAEETVRLVLMLVLSIGLTALCWTELSRLLLRREGTAKRTGKPGMERAAFLILTAVDFVVLLGVYPGFFVYDASEELSMVQSRLFTTHHPLVHVLLLGGIIQAVHRVTGSYNAGIFLYSILQAAAVNAALTLVLKRVRDKSGTLPARLGFLFLLLCPTVSMFTLCTAKDGLFSACLVLQCLLLSELQGDAGAFLQSRRKTAGLILAAAGMMLLRKNGAYAYAVCLILYGIAALSRVLRVRKKHREGALPSGKCALRLAAVLLLPVLLFAATDRTLAAALHARPDGSQEILTVPIQMLARTYVSDPGSFSEEELVLMRGLMSDEDWNRYNPALSDQVKLRFNSEVFRENRQAYIALFFRQGKAHPVTYLNAWLGTSYGFFAPDAVVDCYRGNQVFTFTYGDSSYFGYETELPGVRHSMIPAVDAWYRFLSLSPVPQRIPVLHWFYTPGGIFFLWLFLAGFLVSAGRGKRLLPFAPVLCVWLTVLAGPCTLPRYVVYLWFGFPLALGTALEPAERNEIWRTEPDG